MGVPNFLKVLFKSAVIEDGVIVCCKDGSEEGAFENLIPKCKVANTYHYNQGTLQIR